MVKLPGSKQVHDVVHVLPVAPQGGESGPSRVSSHTRNNWAVLTVAGFGVGHGRVAQVVAFLFSGLLGGNPPAGVAGGDQPVGAATRTGKYQLPCPRRVRSGHRPLNGLPVVSRSCTA